MKDEIQLIAGDASFRKFFRFISKKSSKIIISEDKEKYKNLIAYSAVNNFLRDHKILAPKVLEHNFTKGIVVLEDFGDLSFHKVLSKTKNKFLVYKKLIDFLIKIQKIKPKKKLKTISSQKILWKNQIYDTLHIVEEYSIKHLTKECDLFFDWYLPLFFSKKKTLKIKSKAKKILLKIIKKLNFRNTCFVHRDYHVSNLMKVGTKIGIIDNQDALIGNPCYDLVSLIDDVRIKTSKKLKHQVYRYYLTKAPKFYRINSEKFLEDFNILSVQRSLKIIGIFSRLFKRDKKKKYFKLIPYTWKVLEMRMRSKSFLELRKVLDNNIPKKIRKKIIL